MRLAEAVVVVAAATPEIADWDWRLLRPQRLQPRLDFGISAVRKKRNRKYFYFILKITIRKSTIWGICNEYASYFFQRYYFERETEFSL